MIEVMHGCDISNYQATTPQGYDFYIIKASEGNGYKDPRLDQHYNAVAEMGKAYGFYHYARPDLGNTPESEADYFLSLVGQHAGNCIFALDWEGDSLNYSVDWPLSWCKRVYEKTGVKPLFYCSQYFVSTGKYKAIANFNCGLWMAQYSNAPTFFTSYGWPAIAIWQSGTSPIDQDVFYGNIETWNKYCARVGTTKENPKKDNETIATEVIAGRWGNGAERLSRLRNAGYNPDEIQRLVNERLQPKKTATLETGLEILKGTYGNGHQRVENLRSAGYDAEEAQYQCNKLISIANKTIRGDFGNEPQRSPNLRQSGFNPSTIQEAVNILLSR